MAVVSTVEIQTTALFTPADVRDPLGIWGFRKTLTGLGDGGSLKMTAFAPPGERSAFVYTVYSMIIALISVGVGGAVAHNIKGRILTNWPNIDPQAGVQAYGTTFLSTLTSNALSTAPIGGPFEDPMVSELDRFLLIYDPRSTGGQLSIIELEAMANGVDDVYSFEGYGYYWDRAVMQAPGGPRHPGSS